MKITTLNFWCGVVIGAYGATTIPKYYKKYFGKVEKKNDISKSNVDAGRVPDSNGTEDDQSSVPEQNMYEKISSMYKSDVTDDLKPIDATKIEAGKLADNVTLTIKDDKLVLTNEDNDRTYIIHGGNAQPFKINKNDFGSSGVDQSILNGFYPTASDIETEVKE